MDDATLERGIDDNLACDLMRGDYFAEGDYLKTDIAKGVTRNRSGVRMLSLTSDFLMGLRSALRNQCGEAAEAVFKDCGRNWGKQFAARFEAELSAYYGTPMKEAPFGVFEACVVQSFSHHGWGKLTFDLTHHDKGLVLLKIENAVMANLVGTSEVPVDSLLAGILASLFSHFAGEELDCVQTQCKAMGAADSRFVVTAPTRLTGVADWVAKGRSHDEIIAELAETQA
jgi:predicted hydrocarbon binding protein